MSDNQITASPPWLRTIAIVPSATASSVPPTMTAPSPLDTAHVRYPARWTTLNLASPTGTPAVAQIANEFEVAP